MFNFSVIDFSVFVLVTALAAILAIYNRRQAAAIEEIRDIAEDMVSLQIRDRRAKRELTAGEIDPQTWLAAQAPAVAERRIEVVSARAIQSVQAAELTLKDGGRILVTTLAKPDIQRHDQQQKKGGGRLATFAAKPILVGRYTLGTRTLVDNEFLDIEASVVANRLGLNWNNPTRLWIYVF